MNNNQATTSSEVKTDTKEEAGQDDNLISITDFAKVEIKIGQIVEAENIEKSNKLLKLKVNVGEENPSQIIAGIAKRYQAEEVVGRKALVVSNLKPAKLMGNLSEGMLLCSKLEDGTLELITPNINIPNGAKLS